MKITGTVCSLTFVAFAAFSAAGPRQAHAIPADKDYSLGLAVAAVKSAKTLPKAEQCLETKAINNSIKFVTTYDASGRPCKIYDLSFPTLKGTFQSLAVASVPVQRLTKDDYKAWLRGDYDHVYARMNAFNNNFTDADLKGSWISRLPFKKTGLRAMSTNADGTPTSFHLSDIDVGEDFHFSAGDNTQLRDALSDAQRHGMSIMGTDKDDSLETFVDKPDKLLSKIRFDWNEARRVFDVFLEFDFLPLVGPIDLVDYNTQYKLLVERTVRSVFARAFGRLADFVPNLTARALVKLALAESFQFMEDLYNYHLAELEDTLRMNLAGTIKTDIAAKDLEKGLNLAFIPRISLVTEYVMAKAQGKALSLTALDKTAYQVRYRLEKNRVALNENLHSRLVLKTGCDLEPLFDSFVICRKDGQAKSVYSLMSENVIYRFPQGAPEIFNFAFPAKVLSKRLASYLMATGLQAFTTPIPGFINNELVKTLKRIASSGMADEAYLLNRLTELKRNNGIQTATSAQMTKWLFGQNINPFLVKGERLEDKIIAVNAATLTSRMGK